MDEADFGVLLQCALSRQLLNDHRISAARELVYFLGRQIVERMRRHEERQLIELQIFRGQPPVRQKRGRNDGRGWDAALFEISRVVDTPRRAAPSIAPGIDE